MHAHEMYELYYFLTGEATYLVEGKEYILRAHDLLVLRSAEAHWLMVRADVPYERIVIHFHPLLLSSIDPEGLLLQPFTARGLGTNNLYRAPMGEEAPWTRYFADFDVAYATRPQQRLHILGRLIGVLTTLACANAPHTNAGEEPASEELPRRLIEYVNDHLFQEISLSSLSAVFYLSRSQISRLFRRATGSPCWEYIRLKRLLAARELLRQGQTATSVCESCGFHDYSAFYRAYRAQFGCAPTDGRESRAPNAKS